MKPSTTSDLGIDRTVLLLFGGLAAIAFILIAASGMRSSEERAQDAVDRERNNRGTFIPVEFGLDSNADAP